MGMHRPARAATWRVIAAAVVILPCLVLPRSSVAAQAQLLPALTSEPTSQTAAVPATEPADSLLTVLWKRALGPGNSRIAVAGGLAVTLFSDGEWDLLLALDVASGDEIWRYRIAPTYVGHDGSRDGPHASPVIDAGTVYGLGPAGHLFAVDLASGEEIWSQSIADETATMPLFWGFASTPLVEDDLLIVQTGGSDTRSIVAMDKRTGAQRWSVGGYRVGYQSPAVMTLAGTRQIVAVGNNRMTGIAPRTGQILWTQERSGSTEDGSSEAASLGPNRFLVTSSATERTSDGAVYRVERSDDGFVVEEQWSSRALRGSYAVPVLHGGRLYGFRGAFLTCIDPVTGEPLWRSRQPGGRNLVLAGERLVIVGVNGILALAATSTTGYEEIARVPVFERGAYTAPTLAEGIVYLRNHEEIAAVSLPPAGREPAVTLADAGSGEVTVEGSSEFAAFVRRVGSAQDKDRVIDEFLALQERYPIIEGDRLAHFVYRGPARDVAITSNFDQRGPAEPMRRIPGTDLFYRSVELTPASRWEYRYVVDFEQWIADPLNPPTEERDSSVFTTPGWTEPAYLREPAGSRGTLETFELESTILGNTREVKIWQPADMAGYEQALPLLVVSDGLRVLRDGLMDRTLDNLVQHSVVPLIVAFVGPPQTGYESYTQVGGPQWYREHGGPRTELYARMLAEELVPAVQERYRVIPRPEARSVMGIGSPGLAALAAAVNHPDVFAKVGLHSLRFGPTSLQSSRLLRRPIYEALLSRIQEEASPPGTVYMDWASLDHRGDEEGIDLARDGRLLFELLETRGYRMSGGEFPGGPGWLTWQERIGRLLEALFPLGPPRE